MMRVPGVNYRPCQQLRKVCSKFLQILSLLILKLDYRLLYLMTHKRMGVVLPLP